MQNISYSSFRCVIREIKWITQDHLVGNYQNPHCINPMFIELPPVDLKEMLVQEAHLLPCKNHSGGKLYNKEYFISLKQEVSI